MTDQEKYTWKNFYGIDSQNHADKVIFLKEALEKNFSIFDAYAKHTYSKLFLCLTYMHYTGSLVELVGTEKEKISLNLKKEKDLELISSHKVFVKIADEFIYFIQKQNAIRRKPLLELHDNMYRHAWDNEKNCFKDIYSTIDTIFDSLNISNFSSYYIVHDKFFLKLQTFATDKQHEKWNKAYGSLIKELFKENYEFHERL